MVPIFKGKGDAMSCGAYSGVKLLEHAMKMVEKVLERRMRRTVKVDEMQFGFMPGKGIIDAVFILMRLQEEYLDKEKKLYGICGKRVMANSVLCVKCRKWIHGRCSKVKRVTLRLGRDFVCGRYKN